MGQVGQTLSGAPGPPSSRLGWGSEGGGLDFRSAGSFACPSAQVDRWPRVTSRVVLKTPGFPGQVLGPVLGDSPRFRKALSPLGAPGPDTGSVTGTPGAQTSASTLRSTSPQPRGLQSVPAPLLGHQAAIV